MTVASSRDTAGRMREIAAYLDSIDTLAETLVEHAHPAFRALSSGNEMQRDLRAWADELEAQRSTETAQQDDGYADRLCREEHEEYQRPDHPSRSTETERSDQS